MIGGGNAIDTGRLLDLNPYTSSSQIQELVREDVNGVLQPQVQWGVGSICGRRTNADLMREIGNLCGLSLAEFGLSSQNTGSVLT